VRAIRFFPKNNIASRSSYLERRTSFAIDETGSLTIFSLFLFILLVMISGMAIDMVRLENERVSMQNTIDSAILSASSLSQDKDAEAMVKDYVKKAGFDPELVTVNASEEFAANNTSLVGRRVQASARLSINTIFMELMGISSLNTVTGGGAYESVQNVEISLIVDISGSMGSNSRLTNLKVAAKEFIDLVLTNNPSADRTSISIIPYNATVVVGNELLSRLNASGRLGVVDPVPSYPGSLASFNTEHNYSTCVRFEDNDFDVRAIGATTLLRRVSHFAEGGNSFNTPSMDSRWCNENRSAILPMSNDPVALKAHIDGLSAGGWTAIDNGMKWGVALLDPAINPIVNDMIDSNILSENVRNRPGLYNGATTLKFVVLMTDGENTIQKDLRDEYKNGPSRVWYAASRTSGPHPTLSRQLNQYDGYFVEMPNNPASQRWFVPGSPNTNGDNSFVSETSIPADAVQQDYIDLYQRFSVRDVARFFFRNADSTAESEHGNAVIQTKDSNSADLRLADICTAAKENNRITVFAIGFEAPQGGQDAMRNCASTAGHYFDVNGTQISDAFKSIAGQITMLRLTE
jgi:hypothetical protein